jgi:hypothetical protein
MVEQAQALEDVVGNKGLVKQYLVFIAPLDSMS